MLLILTGGLISIAERGVDFTRIDGLGVLTVQTILSEVGLDHKRFPTVKHFTSWRLFVSWQSHYWW